MVQYFFRNKVRETTKPRGKKGTVAFFHIMVMSQGKGYEV